jgi:hypothetical protein
MALPVTALIIAGDDRVISAIKAVIASPAPIQA